METITYTPITDTYRGREAEIQSFRNDQVIFQAKEQKNPYKPLSETAGIAETVLHFDTFFREEGLEKDWETLSKKVGFSMDSQMKLLKGTDIASKEEWVTRTERDVLGFGLEYLSKGLVYPFQYSIESDAFDNPLLMDKKYGKGMVETTTEKERKGSVKESLARIEAFLGNPNTRDGALAIMASPAGPSGLTTDEGKAITYPDSYWFIMQKIGSEVHGFTIKTDFSLYQTRRAIHKLTGQDIPLDAPVEEYVRALGLIDQPAPELDGIEGVISVLSEIKGSETAFKNQRWNEVYRDIARGDELYAFNDTIQNLVTDFKTYVKENSLSEIQIKKALAALIYRMSKIMIYDEPAQRSGESTYFNDLSYRQVIQPTFGEVLAEVARIPGCAGGGESGVTSISLLGGLRVATIDTLPPDRYGGRTFRCPHCNHENTRPQNQLVKYCQNKGCGKDVSC